MLRASVYLFVALAAIMSQAVNAQDDISVREGRFEVFYSVLNTSFLSTDVAQAIGVKRAKNRGLINLSVIEHLDDKAEQATRPAEIQSISAVLFDLVHTRKILLDEINEPNARYYIGSYKIANDHEKMIFRINVKLEDGDEINFEFMRHLYID